MKPRMIWIAGLGIAAAVGLAAAAFAQPPFARGKLAFRTGLDSYQEVPTLSTAGTGILLLRVNAAEDEAEYALTYDGLEGGAVGAAHIHLGRPATNGGVMAFLCGGGGKPACPASGSVTGTIVAADVIGPAGQGVAPGEFDEFVDALRHRAAYVNVHTATYPGGEIRGAIK